jgi:hypothetical protein
MQHNVSVVNSLNFNSIRRGILQKMKYDRDMDKIAREIKIKFSWKNTAGQTASVYRSLLGQ